MRRRNTLNLAAQPSLLLLTQNDAKLLHKCFRVNRCPIYVDFKMQVRAGRITGTANLGYLLTAGYLLTSGDEDTVPHMCL